MYKIFKKKNEKKLCTVEESYANQASFIFFSKVVLVILTLLNVEDLTLD